MFGDWEAIAGIPKASGNVHIQRPSGVGSSKICIIRDSVLGDSDCESACRNPTQELLLLLYIVTGLTGHARVL